jgi:hypothetical protein
VTYQRRKWAARARTSGTRVSFYRGAVHGQNGDRDVAGCMARDDTTAVANEARALLPGRNLSG